MIRGVFIIQDIFSWGAAILMQVFHGKFSSLRSFTLLGDDFSDKETICTLKDEISERTSRDYSDPIHCIKGP